MNFSHAADDAQGAPASRWDEPRRIPLDQWLREQHEEPPPGSNIVRGNFTSDRQDICMLLAALIESVGDRLQGPVGPAKLRSEARRLQIIGESLTILLIQPRSFATTQQQRARLVAENIIEATG